MRGHVRKRQTWEFIVDIGPTPDNRQTTSVEQERFRH